MEQNNYEEVTESEAFDTLGINTQGMPIQDEETVEERFNKMVAQLMGERGWSPRKATRYLNAIARRNIEKQVRTDVPKKMRQMFKRYRYVPIDFKQKMKKQQQEEYAAQVNAQLAAMEEEKKMAESIEA